MLNLKPGDILVKNNGERLLILKHVGNTHIQHHTVEGHNQHDGRGKEEIYWVWDGLFARKTSYSELDRYYQDVEEDSHLTEKLSIINKKVL